jgi:hypothetical protein
MVGEVIGHEGYKREIVRLDDKYTLASKSKL